MGAISFSSTSARALNPFHPANWKSPIQAALDFFAPSPARVHAVPSEHIVKLGVLGKSVLPPAPRLAMLQQPGQVSLAFSDQVAPIKVALSPCSRSGSLKILREFEPGKSRSSTGRLVISGRMVDVCAALDRMASQSSAPH